MKKIGFFLITTVLLFACGAPSEAIVSTAMSQTQEATVAIGTFAAETLAALPTLTPLPTFTPAPTSTPMPTATLELGTYQNPYPMGQEAQLVQTKSGETTKFVMKIERVIRGPEAWVNFYDANMFNDPPLIGHEAIMILVYVRVTSQTGFLSIDKYDFSISTKGSLIKTYTYSPCCLGNAGFQEFDAKMNPGAEYSGWIGTMVKVDDPSPLLVLGADYEGYGGEYFALTRP